MPALKRLGLGLGLFLYGAVVATAIGAHAADGQSLAGVEAPFANLVVHEAPKPPFDARFEDADGTALTLEDFRGKIVFVNAWATWCPPCRKEMPSIDRMAGALAGEDIAVLAISADRAGAGKVRSFFEEIAVENLAIYVDRSNNLMRAALIRGLPVTMILDREGREIARLTGDAEWDEPAAIEMLRALARGGA